jgi:hypothetical protein
MDPEQRAGSGRAAWLWLPLLLAVAAGCAEPVERRVRLRVSAEPGVGIPGQVDRVTVGVVASGTPSGSLCHPVFRDFVLDGPDDLPIVVDYFPGEGFAYGVAFRLEWYKAGVMVAQRELTKPFPREGMIELEAKLGAGCFTMDPPCASNLQCILDEVSGVAACVLLAAGGYFDNPALIAPGARACDNTEVLDGGGDAGGSDDADADAGDG